MKRLLLITVLLLAFSATARAQYPGSDCYSWCDSVGTWYSALCANNSGVDGCPVGWWQEEDLYVVATSACMAVAPGAFCTLYHNIGGITNAVPSESLIEVPWRYRGTREDRRIMLRYLREWSATGRKPERK